MKESFIANFGELSLPFVIVIFIIVRKIHTTFLRIKSTPNIRVPIKVRVIVPKLVVYHQNTTGDFTLIDFPSTVENTCRYDTFVLRNLSSRVSRYVVLGEIDDGLKCIQVRNKCLYNKL